jgi:hypothetical protein
MTQGTAQAKQGYRIVIHAGAFRIEARGPIQVSRSEAPIFEGAVDTSGKEEFSTDRYAIIGPDGEPVVVRPAVLLSIEWSGTWGGQRSEEVLAVIDGRPAGLRGTAARWFPSARPEPSARAFERFSLPVRELVEFQSTGVPPRGWSWDASSRVLSRSIER